VLEKHVPTSNKLIKDTIKEIIEPQRIEAKKQAEHIAQNSPAQQRKRVIRQALLFTGCLALIVAAIAVAFFCAPLAIAAVVLLVGIFAATPIAYFTLFRWRDINDFAKKIF